MTYGVPYSFVPGTKAKADEVNANFLDVLDKIQTANTRIDSASTTIQECSDSLASKLNTDLSNLTAEGQEMFTGLAKESDLDGTWTEKFSALTTSVSIAVGATQTYSLTNLLPKDSHIYEIMMGITTQTASTSGAISHILVNTDYMKGKKVLVKAVSRHSSPNFGANNCNLVVGTGRSIVISSSASSVSATTYSLELYAYRKVR